TMVYISAILFGARVGGFAGGVGSSLADLYGFPVFAPITFFVKGIEGFVVGRLSHGKESLIFLIISCLAGGVLMVFGYFLAESLMYGIPVALEEVPFNIVQMISGTVISIPTVKTLKKVPQIQELRKP
ncbi:MAG: ECF transporter S component, partial [Candidatus Methanofastidiosia archaeon]